MVLKPVNISTANQAFLDAMIRHQIGLLRVSGGIEKQVITLLNAVEEDIAEKVRSRLRIVSGKGPTPFALKRADDLSKLVANIRNSAWDKVDQVWTRDLSEVATKEPEFVNMAMTTTSPVVLNTSLPAAETLRSIIKTRPFEGKVLKTWASEIRSADIKRLTDQIRIGIVQGETNDQIARRLVGTARLRGTDGVTEITRRQAKGLTRTATIAFSNEAKREMFSENADLIKEEQFVATLDNRTTTICASLDGEKFPVAEGPYPPLHFNCRSIRVAAFDGDTLGLRPFKTSTERQLVKEFKGDKGITRRGLNRNSLPRGTKGEFDKFARKRIRELTGQTPQTTNYQTWLKSQSVEFQNDVLGNTRAILFRKGGLTLDRFVNRAGDDLPLSILAKKEAAAFVKAGLDPGNF